MRLSERLEESTAPHQVSVVIERDAQGYYAFCPQLKGCQSQGDTYEEALENIREAVELYLETLAPEEREAALSAEIRTAVLEVEVA